MQPDYVLALSTAGTAAAIWQLYQQQRAIRSLSFNPSFGVLSQAGSKALLPTLPMPADVLFFDVDQMKLFNSLFGWERTGALVASALAQVQAAYGRRRLVIWQEYSGDEFGAHVRAGDGLKVARLLQAACALQPLTADERTALCRASGGSQTHLSATIGLVCCARNVTAALDAGKALVHTAKGSGKRGGVWTNEGEVQV